MLDVEEIFVCLVVAAILAEPASDVFVFDAKALFDICDEFFDGLITYLGMVCRYRRRRVTVTDICMYVFVEVIDVVAAYRLQ